jgi:signal transduction histidine kinase
MRLEQDSSPAKNGGGRSVVAPNRYLIPIVVTVITVCVFVAAIFLMMSQLRGRLRAKVMEQDSLVLQAAAAAQSEHQTENHEDQLLNMIYASNAITNIFGVRLFDKNGQCVDSFPKDLFRTQLSADVLEAVRSGLPYSRFEQNLEIGSEFRPGTSTLKGRYAVMFATIPIKSDKGEVVAAAEFLMDGSHVIGQLREIDREVRKSAVRFSLVGGSAIFLILSWAFGRLSRANQLLAERSADLLRANHELTMAAKTSAVGAVAAHLIHGLKNPLFGLQAFVTVKSETEAGNEWKAAMDSTKRMQQMISDVVRIMREESGQSGYEVNIEELIGILRSKLLPQAKDASVGLELNSRADGALPNREANLIILVLTNLIQNAIQASKTGQTICLEICERDGAVCFDLTDQAGGLPAAMMANLFTPCQSSKAGGTGLGLAISKQLANHLGGRLELVKTDQQGTTFRLAIPRELFVGATSKGALEAENAVA